MMRVNQNFKGLLTGCELQSDGRMIDIIIPNTTGHAAERVIKPWEKFESVNVHYIVTCSSSPIQEPQETCAEHRLGSQSKHMAGASPTTTARVGRPAGLFPAKLPASTAQPRSDQWRTSRL